MLSYIWKVPSNFTKIVAGTVALGDLEPGTEVWSPCPPPQTYVIKLKVDKRVTNPVGEWRWRLDFTYDGTYYELENVPML